MKSGYTSVAVVLLVLCCGVLFAPNDADASGDEAVVVSIKPIHSLVAAVMKGVGEPHLIVRGFASPHTYVMKPSDASALGNARAVFWIGPELERFLEKPIVTLAPDARVVSLAGIDGLTTLKFREGGPFEGHEEHEEHEGHEAGSSHDEHETGETDMHLWLDPVNAAAMVQAIGRALSRTFPEHAAEFQANAASLAKDLGALTDELTRELSTVRHRPFIVFHDGYQYFERRFGLKAAGSVTVNPDVGPGARRVSEIRDKVARLGASCVFAEPQFESRLVQVVTQGTKTTVGVLDPLGAYLEDGPELYFELMRAMAKSIKTCLSNSS